MANDNIHDFELTPFQAGKLIEADQALSAARDRYEFVQAFVLDALGIPDAVPVQVDPHARPPTLKARLPGVPDAVEADEAQEAVQYPEDGGYGGGAT